MVKEIFECSHCNQIFLTKEECKKHEQDCLGNKKLNYRRIRLWSGIILFIILLIAIILLWGFIGGVQTKSVGITCDFGIGDLCWSWHKNLIGKFSDSIKSVLG